MSDTKKNTPLSMVLPVVAIREKLESILQSLQNNEVPNSGIISNLQQSFSDYFIACKYSEEILPTIESADKTEKEKLVIWKNQFPSEDEVIFFDSSLLCEKDNIRILKRFVLEKLIPVSMITSSKNFINYLFSIGYVAIANANVLEKDYYLLTTSGWYWMMLQQTKDILAEKDSTFALSEKLVPKLELWTDSSFFQLEQIRKYYEIIGVDEFMVFEESNMLFGCEVRDSYTVSYCFAVGHDGNLDEMETSRIFELGKSSRIDNLTIIVYTASEENRLKMQKGLDVHCLSKLRFYIMTEEER